MENLQIVYKKWCSLLEEAMKMETMKYYDEAASQYRTLSAEIQATADQYRSTLPREHSLLLEKVWELINDRADGLLGDSVDSDSLPYLQRQLESLSILFGDLNSDVASQGVKEIKESSQISKMKTNGLHYYVQSPAVLRAKNTEYLDVKIISINVKNAQILINPVISVAVYDCHGAEMEGVIETEVGTSPSQHEIIFGTTISLGTNLQELQKQNGAIIFELLHYKPKKRKKSCKCWTLFEIDELKDISPSYALELYEKPIDPKRKNIKLFTVKPHYLHVQIRRIQN